MPTAAAGQTFQAEMLQLLLFMGSEWILYLLMFLSVLSVAVAIERLIHFWMHRGDLPALQRALNARLEEGKLDGARQLLEAHPSHPAKVVLAGLRALPHGSAAVEEVMAGETQVVRLEMERGIAFLGTLGNNAPFIGLFGTVLGIIRAFRDLASNISGSQAVMAGIAEALVTTAVGLMVALPAVAIFNMFQRRIRVQLASVDAVGHILLAHAKSTKGA